MNKSSFLPIKGLGNDIVEIEMEKRFRLEVEG